MGLVFSKKVAKGIIYGQLLAALSVTAIAGLYFSLAAGWFFTDLLIHLTFRDAIPKFVQMIPG